MDLDKLLKSEKFTRVFIGIGFVIILLLVFRAGMAIGFRKANFSYRWGENYHKNFGGPKEGFLKEFSGRDFIDAHGVAGQIIKIDSNVLVIKGRDNIEKIVLIDDKTTIERFRELVKNSNLKIDDYAIVIGEPNDLGQIVAKFIRLMPRQVTR